VTDRSVNWGYGHDVRVDARRPGVLRTARSGAGGRAAAREPYDHHDYDPVADRLSGSYTTIAVDCPGHGRSGAPVPPAPVDATVLADTLADVADGHVVFASDPTASSASWSRSSNP